jgi:HPr kinase/phosphorylase
MPFAPTWLRTVAPPASRPTTFLLDEDSPHSRFMRVHGSCAARNGRGVLLTGSPGAGKSDLVLRLLDRGFALVADDQVEIAAGVARAPPSLAGLLEVRGLGIVRLPYLAAVSLSLVVHLSGPDLADSGPRLPEPVRDPLLDLPVIRLDPRAASAPIRVALALDCALGRVAQGAGVFAA